MNHDPKPGRRWIASYGISLILHFLAFLAIVSLSIDLVGEGTTEIAGPAMVTLTRDDAPASVRQPAVTPIAPSTRGTAKPRVPFSRRAVPPSSKRATAAAALPTIRSSVNPRTTRASAPASRPELARIVEHGALQPRANPGVEPTYTGVPIERISPPPTFDATAEPVMAVTTPQPAALRLPTAEPVEVPTNAPATVPTVEPRGSLTPSEAPPHLPLAAPTAAPALPTDAATRAPTAAPTLHPSNEPTTAPAPSPAANPTQAPSVILTPAAAPIPQPTSAPTLPPARLPAISPTAAPVAQVTPAAKSTAAASAAPKPALTSPRPAVHPSLGTLADRPALSRSSRTVGPPRGQDGGAAGRGTSPHPRGVPSAPRSVQASPSEIAFTPTGSKPDAAASLNDRLKRLAIDGNVDYTPKRVAIGDAQSVYDDAMMAYEARFAPPPDILRRTFGYIYNRRTTSAPDSLAYVYDTYSIGPITMCKAWKIEEHPNQAVHEVGAVAGNAGIGGAVVTSQNSANVRHDAGGDPVVGTVVFPCTEKSYTSIRPGSLNGPLSLHPDLGPTRTLSPGPAALGTPLPSEPPGPAPSPSLAP